MPTDITASGDVAAKLPGQWIGKGTVISNREPVDVLVETSPGNVIAGVTLTAAHFADFVKQLNTHAVVRHYDATESTPEAMHATELGIVVPASAVFDGERLRLAVRVGRGLVQEIKDNAYITTLLLNVPDMVVSGVLLVRRADINADGTFKATFVPRKTAPAPVLTRPANPNRLTCTPLRTLIRRGHPSAFGILYADDVINHLLAQLLAKEYPIARAWSPGRRPVNPCGHTMPAGTGISADGWLTVGVELLNEAHNEIVTGAKGLFTQVVLQHAGGKPAVDNDPAPPETYAVPTLLGFSFLDAIADGPFAPDTTITILRLKAP